MEHQQSCPQSYPQCDQQLQQQDHQAAASSPNSNSHHLYNPESKETENSSYEDDLMIDPSSADDEHNNNNNNNNQEEEEANAQRRHYSLTELVRVLGNHNDQHHQQHHQQLPQELQRRVLDFRLAQQKRKQKYGTVSHNKWGVFGMYHHLKSLRIDLEWAEDAAYRRLNNLPYMSWADFNNHRHAGRNRPWCTYCLVLLCTIMLVVEFAVNDFQVEPMNVNPMIGPSRQTLIDVGARDTDKIIYDGEWFRIVTPLVLHAGIIHYCINMVALYFIGSVIEQSHGKVNLMLLFLIPGIGANILSAIFLPEFVSVGASGGIFGLIGACVADIYLNWDLLFISSDTDETERQVILRNALAVVFLVVEILVNILLGLVCPFIDNWAHLGGFIYGLCCAFSLLEPLEVGFFGVNNTAFEKCKLLFVKFFGLVLSVFLILASSVYLATAKPGDNPCEGCRYISCVPFPFFAENKWWYCDDCDFVTAILKKEEGGKYIGVDLNCPNGVVETIDVSDENLESAAAVQRNLPSYCRDVCDSVFE